ncbi:MAG TPA: GNAT family N-acetyltransferase [Jatrophihabitans sp.]|nr:GNAT family N-acetyltransferase [Jatrophihabitans sp.]
MRLHRYDEVKPTSEQRKAFDCGHESLNRWLATQARQSMETRDAVTWLLMDGETIAGYFCLSAGSVIKEAAPAELARRAPNPIPVIRMGRFALDVAYQGQGWGGDLLAEAIRSAVSSLDVIGARVMLVDAINEAAKSFYLKHGFVASPVVPMQLMVRLQVAQVSQAAAIAAQENDHTSE